MPEFVSIEDAFHYATKVAKDREVPIEKSDFLNQILKALRPVEARGVLYFPYDDVKAFTTNFTKYAEEKDVQMLKRKRGQKVEYTADIIEFVESKEFMGMKGAVFPIVKEALWNIWHTPDKNYIECVLTGSTGCLVGETQLRLNRRVDSAASRIYTIRDAYEKTHQGGRYSWSSEVTTKALALKEGCIGYHETEDIIYSGKKAVYEVTTNKGKKIVVTEEHPFKVPSYIEDADPDGFKQLRHLKVGDSVLCRTDAPPASGRKPNRERRHVYSVPYHPYALKQFIGGRDYKRISYSRLLVEADMNDMPVNTLVKILRNDPDYASELSFIAKSAVVHHIDGDPLNDSLDNLVVITKEEHDRLHGYSNVVNFKHALPGEEVIVSIKSRGEQETYDVIMKPPYHNYVANDFIVHNTGKSFISEMCVSYMLYKLSLLYDPQAELDLAPGSPLFLVLQSGSLQQASTILFKPLYNRLALTKYFTETFPFQKDIRSELIFPNGITIRPFSGSDDAVLGLTVLGGVVTELNRMAYVAKSRKNPRAKTTAEEQFYDQAVAIYTTLIRRMVGRTMQLGKLWGKLVLDAAHEHEDDFTSRKIKESRTNPTIYIYKKMQWEATPEKRYGGEKFLVEVGNETRRSRIIHSLDESVEPEKVMEVPKEYEHWFEQDVEGSLRDFAGIVIGSQQPAIPFREKITEGMENFKKITGGQQLFLYPTAKLQEFKLSYEVDDNWEALVNMNYIQNILLDKKAEFVCHVDPGIKHDAMGIAVGHIAGYSLLPPVKRYNPRKKQYEERRDIRAPILMMDGILKVVAPYGEEVDLDMCQRLILFLTTVINLTTVSIDSYQSAQMIQAWRTAGLVTGNVSVDDTMEPYTRVKIAYRDGRLWTPEHAVYKDEILNLQLENGKYDHLIGKSKDCSDAVAGTCYLLETHIAEYIPESPHTQKSEVEPKRGERRGRWLGRPSVRHKPRVSSNI